jgi:hypothetical protein
MYDNKAINEKWQNIMQQGILPYKKKNGIVWKLISTVCCTGSGK